MAFFISEAVILEFLGYLLIRGSLQFASPGLAENRPSVLIGEYSTM
jgi:hypothetical protein